MSLRKPQEVKLMITQKTAPQPGSELRSAVVRFAGDSGDGMQVVGDQSISPTHTRVVAGYRVAPGYSRLPPRL